MRFQLVARVIDRPLVSTCFHLFLVVTIFSSDAVQTLSFLHIVHSIRTKGRAIQKCRSAEKTELLWSTRYGKHARPAASKQGQ